MFQFFKKKKTSLQSVNISQHGVYGSINHHKHQALSKTSEEIMAHNNLRFMGHEAVSENQVYRILYHLSTGKCYFFKNHTLLKTIKIQYLGIVIVSNNGYFLICDLLDRNQLDGYFYVFDVDIDLVIKKYVQSNIHAVSFSKNSRYASLQTEGNPSHEDGNKMFIFDLKDNQCIGNFIPDAHWSHHHLIHEKDQTVQFVFESRIEEYKFDGSVVERQTHEAE